MAWPRVWGLGEAAEESLGASLFKTAQVKHLIGKKELGT